MKLDCCFMDACRKHKILVSQTMDLVTHSTVSITSISMLTLVPLGGTMGPGDNMEDPDRYLYMQYVAL